MRSFTSKNFVFFAMITMLVLLVISLITLLYTSSEETEIPRSTEKRVVILGSSSNMTIMTSAMTVGGVLQQLNVAVGNQDIVEPSISTEVEDGMEIRITRIAEGNVDRIVELPFATVTYDDPSLELGKEMIIQEGVPGQVSVKTTYRTENGQSIEEEISQEVLKPYVAKVVAMGTAKPQPVVITDVEETPELPAPVFKMYVPPVSEVQSEPNQTITSEKVKSFEVGNKPVDFKYKLDQVELTAFTAGFESTGKNPGDYGYGVTASGAIVNEGQTIAVDPTVIPLGWWVYIEGIGYRKAEDTGSAIKGKKIDIFIADLKAAQDFGRRYNYTVYVIGPYKPN